MQTHGSGLQTRRQGTAFRDVNVILETSDGFFFYQLFPTAGWLTRERSGLQLTRVDAGAGGRDAELGLDELRDEGDESGDDGAFCRVGQADKQEGHVAEDPHGGFGQV